MKHVSKAKCGRLVRRAGAKVNWFHFRRDFVMTKLLTRNQAMFLQDLMNHSEIHADDEDWFLCTVEYLQRSLDWDRNIQNRMLTRFQMMKYKGEKFVEVENRVACVGGIKSMCRYIKINVVAIEAALDDALRKEGFIIKQCHTPEGGSSSNNDGGSITKQCHKEEETTSLPKQKKKEHCRSQTRDGERSSAVEGKKDSPKTIQHAAKPAKPSRPSDNGKENLAFGDRSAPQQMANKLFQGINAAGLAKVPGRRPITSDGWHHSFRRLIREVDADRVWVVLRWFTANIKDKFTPAVRCAVEFRKQFNRIVEAMERKRNEDAPRLKGTAGVSMKDGNPLIEETRRNGKLYVRPVEPSTNGYHREDD